VCRVQKAFASPYRPPGNFPLYFGLAILTPKCSLPQKRNEHAVAQLVDELRYKPEGRGFIFQMGLLGIFIDLIFPGDSACNRNEYQGHLMGGGEW
jgi:hypothetical protein